MDESKPPDGPVGSSAVVRRIVTRVVNPVILGLGLAGGERSMFGVITHVGRTSGRRLQNPILPHVAGDVVLIPLSYGTEVNWVQNVLAAGSADLRFRNRSLHLVEPVIVTLDDVLRILPDGADRAYGRMRMRAFLRLRVERSASAA